MSVHLRHFNIGYDTANVIFNILACLFKFHKSIPSFLTVSTWNEVCVSGFFQGFHNHSLKQRRILGKQNRLCGRLSFTQVINFLNLNTFIRSDVWEYFLKVKDSNKSVVKTGDACGETFLTAVNSGIGFLNISPWYTMDSLHAVNMKSRVGFIEISNYKNTPWFIFGRRKTHISRKIYNRHNTVSGFKNSLDKRIGIRHRSNRPVLHYLDNLGYVYSKITVAYGKFHDFELICSAFQKNFIFFHIFHFISS